MNMKTIKGTAASSGHVAAGAAVGSGYSESVDRLKAKVGGGNVESTGALRQLVDDFQQAEQAYQAAKDNLAGAVTALLKVHGLWEVVQFTLATEDEGPF
jgi:hypothetical protein